MIEVGVGLGRSIRYAYLMITHCTPSRKEGEGAGLLVPGSPLKAIGLTFLALGGGPDRVEVDTVSRFIVSVKGPDIFGDRDGELFVSRGLSP